MGIGHKPAGGSAPGSISSFITITTSRFGARGEQLARLADSLAHPSVAIPEVTIRPYLLLQEVPDGSPVQHWLPQLERFQLLTTDRSLSLSRARNLLLAQVLAGEDLSTALVAFPDDDAWYPPHALAQIVGRFRDDERLDFWFCDFAPARHEPACGPVTRPSLQQVLSHATSNTIVLRGSLAMKLGGFDEALGLGTPAMSGEDTDYALRAFRAARKTGFRLARAIGHRERLPEDRVAYFDGALYALARHVRLTKSGYFAAFRKMMVGIALVLMGQMPARRLVSAARKALLFPPQPPS